MIKNIYRRLQFFFVPKKLKKNFKKISDEHKQYLGEKIRDIYIPTISDMTSHERLTAEVQLQASRFLQ